MKLYVISIVFVCADNQAVRCKSLIFDFGLFHLKLGEYPNKRASTTEALFFVYEVRITLLSIRLVYSLQHEQSQD